MSSTVKVSFLGDADSLARAAKMARGEVDKVSASVGKAAKIGSFLGTAGANLAGAGLSSIRSFAAGAVDAYAAVEDATGAASVQFGESLPAVLTFADKAAASFGLSKRAALDAQNTFGTFGKAAGLTGEALSGFSGNLTGLAGDMASFKGTSTEQAIEAIGSALRGETEPIRAYGVMLDAASIKAEAMATGLIKPTKNLALIKEAQTKAQLAQRSYNDAVKKFGPESDKAARAKLALGAASRNLEKQTQGVTGELTTQQKTLAVQSLILKQTKDAQGDYARTSKSTANTQKTLKAETENAQAALGKKLAPALTAVRRLMLTAIRATSGLATGLGKASDFAKRHQAALKVVAAVIAAVVLPALARLIASTARAGVVAVVNGAKQVASWLATQGAAYRSIVAQVAAFTRVVAGWVLMGVQSLRQAARMAAAWFIALGPIGWAIAAITAVAVIVIKNWDTIKNATSRAWGYVKDKVMGVVGFLTTLFLNFTGPGLLIKHWDTIVNTIKAMPGRISAAARGMFDGIKNAFRSAINWIVDKWNDLSFSIGGFDPPGPGPKFGGVTVGTPNIPRLAQGGIVRAQPGGILANIGEGRYDEAVVPLDGRRLGGGDVNLYVTGVIDDAMVRKLETMLARVARVEGRKLAFQS